MAWCNNFFYCIHSWERNDWLLLQNVVALKKKKAKIKLEHFLHTEDPLRVMM